MNNVDEEKIDQLERAMLELGTEIFRLKSEVNTVQSANSNILEVMNGLKQLLDEQGVINSDDFDNAVNLGEAINLSATTSIDHNFEDEIEKIKKTSH